MRSLQKRRLANLLDTKSVWEDGTAVIQCRDKGKWRTMTKFEIRNNMAYASQMQFEGIAESSMGSAGPASDSLQLAVLGKSGTRPKDDIISNTRCESEDV